MSQVKLVARTLNLFELYAEKGEPLTLTELSHGLPSPMSSTLSMVRTLVDQGYLYQTRKRTYYPTRKLINIGSQIDRNDPILDALRPHLIKLRDLTRETVVLGTREDLRVVYLETETSGHSIRYTTQAGETRQPWPNSMGKALLSVLDEEELTDVLDRLNWDEIYSGTVAFSKPQVLNEVALAREQGWAQNMGESDPDLAALAAPFSLAGKWYGLSIVGPITRMKHGWKLHQRSLISVITHLEKEFSDNDLQ